MHQHEWIAHRQSADFQAVDLAYEGDDLSMVVLLPNRKDGLQGLEKALSARMLDDCVRSMFSCQVELFLPRFKVTWGDRLRGHLITLGMPQAFTPLADFSGINGNKPPSKQSFFISDVVHKAFVEVNEEGTQAAAATATVMLTGMSEPAPNPIFRADHPFLFAIRERKSGAILFLGRITDPTRDS